MGIKALRKLQLGREVTPGTAVAATTIWRGTDGMIDDQQHIVFPDEQNGYLSGVDRSYADQVLAKIALASTPATFEQLPHLLEMGIQTVTPSADGVGSGKISAYIAPTTAPNTIKTYTGEAGDDQQEEEVENLFAEEITLEGKAGESWMMSGGLVGRQVTLSTFSGSIAVPSIEEMLFGKTKLYIDAVGGAIGTTLKSSTLLAAKLAIKTGWFARFTGDGQLYFTRAAFDKDKMEWLLDITFEHDGTAVAEKAAKVALTPRQIELKVEGSALTTPGTYTHKTAKMDIVGKWEKFSKIGDDNGNDIVTGTLRGRFNAVAAKFAQIIIVNELAALP